MCYHFRHMPSPEQRRAPLPIEQPDMKEYFEAQKKPAEKPAEKPKAEKPKDEAAEKRQAELKGAMGTMGETAVKIQSVVMKLDRMPADAEDMLDEMSDGEFLIDTLNTVRAVNKGETPPPGFLGAMDNLAQGLEKLAAKGRLDRIHKADALLDQLKQALENSGRRKAA